MLNGLQITQINFLRAKKQSDNDGAFPCPACGAWASLKGAQWPGTPSIEATILQHYSCCEPKHDVPDPLLFFLSDTNGHMAPGLVVVDRRIRQTAIQLSPTGNRKQRNLHVAQSAIVGSQSPKRLARLISGPYVAEHEGVEIAFVFQDLTQFSIYESTADTLESLTLAAYKRLLNAPSRWVA
jgi:hypothetical protein